MLAPYAGMAADFATWVVGLVKQYPNFMALIVLVLAFGESLAFVSLVFPFSYSAWGWGPRRRFGVERKQAPAARAPRAVAARERPGVGPREH